MNILIADDELIARKVLGAFLERTGYKVEIVTDGQAAVDRLQEIDAPPIAILDRSMPKLTGLEVCKHLRSHPGSIRHYLIVLSARGEKGEVAAGLDAGADDYLTKPFNPVELLARLRVAQRAIDYQQQLHTSILDLQSLLQRYHLLGEMVAPTHAPAPTSCPIIQPPPAASEPSVFLSETQTRAPNLPFEQGDIDQLVLRTLNEFRLGAADVSTVTLETNVRQKTIVAWSSVLLRREGTWIDLVMEAEPSSVQVIYEKTLHRRAPTDRALCDLQAEILSIIASALRSLLAARGCEVLLPFLSRAMRTDNLLTPPPVPEGRKIRNFSLPNAELRLSVIPQWQAIRRKTAGQLKEYDILAEPFRSPALQDVLLLNEGVVLTERFIEKLSTVSQNEKAGLALDVFQPSALAMFFSVPSADHTLVGKG